MLQSWSPTRALFCLLPALLPGASALNSGQAYTDSNGASYIIRADTASISAKNMTQAAKTGPTLTATRTIANGAAVTLQPITTLLQTLPAGGSMTSISRGSTTGSYYVYSSIASSLDLGSGGSISLCFDCCIFPCVVTGAQALATATPPMRLAGGNRLSAGMNRAEAVTGTGTAAGTCPTTRLGTGTTTIYTTYTLTQCGLDPVCPNDGSGIIGASNSTSTPSANTVSTTFSGLASRTSSSTMIATSPSPTDPGVFTTPPVCPYNQNQLYSDSYGKQYVIICDTLFTDNIIGNMTEVILADCISACDKYNQDSLGMGTQCAGTSFTPATQNCLLFDSTEDSTPSAGTHSSRLVMRAGPGYDDTASANTIPLTYVSAVVTPSSYVPPANRLVTTITETTVSISLGFSTIVSTEISTVHDGATQTIVSTFYGSGTVTTYGATLTETTTLHDGATVTAYGTTTAPTETTTVFVYPSSSVYSSTCRTTPTAYLQGSTPAGGLVAAYPTGWTRKRAMYDAVIDIGSVGRPAW